MREIEALGLFYLGRVFDAEKGAATPEPYLLEARDLTTHAVCVGMTGSGKTGLGIALLEEAAIDGVPAIAIDPKGDLGNLALAFPALRPEDFEPWIDPDDARRAGRSPAEQAAATAERWRQGLAESGQDAARIERFRRAAEVVIYTPGSLAGRPLSPLRSFAAPAAALAADPEALRERAQAAVSGLLALLGRDADPLQSREHILLARLVAEAWERGADLDLPGLIRGLEQPPFARVGALELESFYPARERFALAGVLNNLLASPAFAAWLEGEPLEIGRLLRADDGRPRISVLSIAHLSDAERMFFVTLLLSELVAWMRSQPGTQSLRALLYMDEVFGYLPPTANPPSKTPLLTLLKQARAFGLGVVLATQNPVDLDYKALGNAGTWFLGRLQTERDRARVAEGLASAATGALRDRAGFERQLGNLGNRVFLARSAHEDVPVMFQTRFALSYLRGPLTREDLRRLRGAEESAAQPPGAKSALPPGAAPAPATSRPIAAALEAGPPLLPPEIEQVYLAGAGSVDCYRPALFAEAQIHYVSAPHGIDSWERVRLLVPLDPGDGRPLFEEARELPAGTALGAAPAPGARFEALPDGTGRPARFAAWGKELARTLQRDRALQLLRSEAAKQVSRPGESEGEFRARLREHLREQRDAGARCGPRALRAPHRGGAGEARGGAGAPRARGRPVPRPEAPDGGVGRRQRASACSSGAAAPGSAARPPRRARPAAWRASTATWVARRISVRDAEEDVAGLERELRGRARRAARAPRRRRPGARGGARRPAQGRPRRRAPRARLGAGLGGGGLFLVVGPQPVQQLARGGDRRDGGLGHVGAARVLGRVVAERLQALEGRVGLLAALPALELLGEVARGVLGEAHVLAELVVGPLLADVDPAALLLVDLGGCLRRPRPRARSRSWSPAAGPTSAARPPRRAGRG